MKILIADDHPLFRRGLSAYFDEIKNCSIVAQASNGEEVIKFLNSLKIDIVLLDINLPVYNGFELLSIIRHEHNNLKVIMLTMHDEVAYAQRAFDLGANAYLVKDDAEELLEDCLCAINKGERFCSLGDIDNEIDQDIKQLSEAERHIFSLVALGKSSYEIAALLNISVRTVDNHRGNIAKKLGLRGTNALLKYAIQKSKIE